MARKATLSAFKLAAVLSLLMGSTLTATPARSASTDGSSVPSLAGPRLAQAAPHNGDRQKTQNATRDAVQQSQSHSVATGDILPNTAETIRERFASGAIRIERNVSLDTAGNYVNHGLWTEFDERGAPVASGQFKNGKLHGKWQRRYGDGQGKLFTGPDFAGFQYPFATETSFDNGVMTGVWYVVDANRCPVCEWEFVNGQREGKSVWYTVDGKRRREATYHTGQIDGVLLEFTADGTLLSEDRYLQGRKLAKEVLWHAPGDKKAEGLYLYPQPYLSVAYDWWNGSAKVVPAEKNLPKLKHGEWSWWFPSGQLRMTGAFEEGIEVGRFTWWYPSGQKQLQGAFDRGVRVGHFTWWHENGQKELDGEYAAGVMQGKWGHWATNGKLIQMEDYTGHPTETVVATDENPAAAAKSKATARRRQTSNLK